MIEKTICVGRSGRVVAVECQTILNGGSVGFMYEVQQCPALKPPSIVDEKGFLAS